MNQPCRACGSIEKSVLLFNVSGNEVVKCTNCSHVFLNNVHTDESLRKMYVNYAKEKRSFYLDPGQNGEYIGNLDDYLGRILGLIPSTVSNPRLLDIGSGGGHLVRRAQKIGFSVEGVEICLPLADRTRKELGCVMHTEPLGNLDLPDAHFDVITMYDLLEHLQ